MLMLLFQLSLDRITPLAPVQAGDHAAAAPALYLHAALLHILLLQLVLLLVLLMLILLLILLLLFQVLLKNHDCNDVVHDICPSRSGFLEFHSPSRSRSRSRSRSSSQRSCTIPSIDVHVNASTLPTVTGLDNTSRSSSGSRSRKGRSRSRSPRSSTSHTTIATVSGPLVKKSRWFGIVNPIANLEDLENKIIKINHFIWAITKATSEKLKWCGSNIYKNKIYSLVYYTQPINVETLISIVQESWKEVEIYPVQRKGTHCLQKEVIRLLVERDFLQQRGKKDGIQYIKNFPPCSEPDMSIDND